jgi:hypothetical protein
MSLAIVTFCACVVEDLRRRRTVETCLAHIADDADDRASNLCPSATPTTDPRSG